MGIRDAILGADDLPREKMDTPEWAPFGAPYVYVRGLSAGERDDWEMSLTVPTPDGGRRPNPKAKNTRARFAVLVICDESGAPVFTPGDIEKLATKSSVVIDRLALRGMQLSGMTADEGNAPNPTSGDPDDTNSPDSPWPSDSTLTSTS